LVLGGVSRNALWRYQSHKPSDISAIDHITGHAIIHASRPSHREYIIIPRVRKHSGVDIDPLFYYNLDATEWIRC
jgi:hypothetical protein